MLNSNAWSHLSVVTCEIDIGNPKTRNSRNWFRYETFIQLFEFKDFPTWGERHNLSMLTAFTSSALNPTNARAPVAHKVVWPRLVNLLLLRQELNSLLFLKSQPTLPMRDVTQIPWVIPIWDFYFDISEWPILSARAWTPALMSHLTNPCAKRKVLIQTKPKAKIYKTKSLRHYITVCANKWLILNRIIHIWQEYLKPFNRMPTNELWLV